jgi:hypothetical protein
VRDAVQTKVACGATEEQAAATIRWPQYEKMQSYDAQRETAVRRLYQQLTGTRKGSVRRRLRTTKVMLYWSLAV